MFVTTNAKSLAEASNNQNLYPFAVYDYSVIGHENPTAPMIGFTMYEVTAGVGFILRLMIASEFQRQGYGRAAMIEVIRRLNLYPEVQLIATSHLRENLAAEKLYRGLGFVPWDIEWAAENPNEQYLMLPQ